MKYFHELTQDEFDALVEEGISWEECAKRHPQPEWCTYPMAINGAMGCWSLLAFMVENEDYCRKCDCYEEITVVTRQEQRETRKSKNKMPQHGKSLAKVYRNAVAKRNKEQNAKRNRDIK